MTRVSVVGGSGYVGGELVRLLLGHPVLELGEVTSGSHPGRPLSSVHPNLRGFTEQRFTDPSRLESCDAIIVTRSGAPSDPSLDQIRELAPAVVDCGPRLRLRDPAAYRSWYGDDPLPEAVLTEAVYGLPELHRRQLVGAQLASGVGCSAAAAILALLPLARAGWLLASPAVIEARFGSSAAGSRPGPGGHHPERSGAVRVFAPEGHRHQAEVVQALGWGADQISYAGVALEMVRGISVSVRCFLRRAVTESELWEAFRSTYQDEPFVRIVAQRAGLHRYPDPRWLVGTNICDVGFALDRSGQRLTLLAALDNLGKGAAGNAVQSLNCMLGIEEQAGLAFTGLHPL